MIKIRNNAYNLIVVTMKLQDIVKTENIIRISPDDTLSTALSKLSTSHDSAFIISDKNEIRGLINPYYALIKSSYPGNAKVEHVAFHPPRIFLNYPLEKVIQLIIESKVHYLPIYDTNNNWKGIISSRRILSSMRHDKRFNVRIADVLNKKNNKSLLTIYEDDDIAEALTLFKHHRVSKLIVINSDFKLKGILAYYDLVHFLIAPKKKETKGDREGNKVSFTHQKVRNFSKSLVLTLKPQDTMASALKMILDKKIGSVVIVDNQKHPIGIITTRDLLLLLTRGNSGVTFEYLTKNISKKNDPIVKDFTNQFSRWIGKLPNIVKARLMIKEEKNGGVFQVLLSLIPQKGKQQVFKREGKDLVAILKDVDQSIKGRK